MLEDLAVDQTGGSYKEYGPLMQAFTGFEDSRQKTPSYPTGRICDFEESGRLGPRAYSIIKEARGLTTGDPLNGKPVLPGAGAIWTTNPVGPRYPDRRAPDPAMRRELAENGDELVIAQEDRLAELPAGGRLEGRAGRYLLYRFSEKGLRP